MKNEKRKDFKFFIWNLLKSIYSIVFPNLLNVYLIIYSLMFVAINIYKIYEILLSQTIHCHRNIKSSAADTSDLFSSTSLFSMTSFVSNLFHIIITSTTYLPIFEVFVLYNFTSTWILEFFYYFSLPLSVLIYSCLFGNSLLLAILYDSLLTNRFTHSTTHTTTETAWLEWITTTSTTLHSITYFIPIFTICIEFLFLGSIA